MKERLIILSDLWGLEANTWMAYYTERLGKRFAIHVYDSCQLGAVSTTDRTEENLHRQFVCQGIDHAVSRLTICEESPVYILGFSVGGTIGWKAAIHGLPAKYLYAISSTRLRYESTRPENNTTLYYGQHDPYRPTDEWCHSIPCDVHILPGQDHTCYTQQETAQVICAAILAL